MTKSAAARAPAHDLDFPRHLSGPEGGLACLVAGQLFLWTLIPRLVSWSLPLDVVSDGIAWGHEWQWGYYKHPPLPSWLSELFFDALGKIGPYLLSQIAIVATYGLVFLLGRAVMPARWAAAGTLLLAGVYYFSIPTPEFNHNVAQMPLWAAASLAYYKAWRSGGLGWWAALGAAAGLGLLAKYATGILLLSMLLHFAFTRGLKALLLRPGPWIAILVCGAILTPHLIWLFHSGFPTLHYAIGRAGRASSEIDRFVAPAKFLLAQAIDIAPAFLAAALAGLLSGWVRRPPRNADLDALLWLTLCPPLLTAVVSLATGLGIRDMWGAPMWNLTGLVIALAALLAGASPNWKRLVISVCALFVVGLSGYLLSNVFVPELVGRASRIQWPARKMATAFAADWESRFHRPLAIIAADGWIGGLVSMNCDPRPSVWIDASFVKSPWITPGRVALNGALVLWRVRDREAAPDITRLHGLHVLGVKSFAWPTTPKQEPLRIGYGIVPPGTPGK